MTVNIEDIVIVIKKKAKRNGKVFEKRVPLSKILQHTHYMWEGDTYQILEKPIAEINEKRN